MISCSRYTEKYFPNKTYNSIQQTCNQGTLCIAVTWKCIYVYIYTHYIMMLKAHVCLYFFASVLASKSNRTC